MDPNGIGDSSTKEYLKNFYENLPIFDESNTNFDQNSDSYWVKIARYILSEDAGATDKMIGFINRGLTYQEKLDTNDIIAKQIVSRKARDIFADRIPRFPLQVSKIKRFHVNVMDKISNTSEAKRYANWKLI